MKDIGLKLNRAETLILQNRIIGLSFNQIEKTEIKVALDEVLLKGAAICGCGVPETEFFADVIAGVFYNFLINFGYGDLTIGEIILSMEMNATGDLHYENEVIKFYGNTLNITYLAAVLKRYMVIRNTLDGKIKNKIEGYSY